MEACTVQKKTPKVFPRLFGVCRCLTLNPVSWVFSLFPKECPVQSSQRHAESQVPEEDGVMVAKWKAESRNDEGFLAGCYCVSG